MSNPYPDFRFSPDRVWHNSHFLKVPIAKIRLHYWPEQRRQGRVEFLIADIRRHGLASPVSLVLMDEGFFAVSNGRHRITAYENMRRRVIPSLVEFAEDQESLLRQLLGQYRQPHPDWSRSCCRKCEGKGVAKCE